MDSSSSVRKKAKPIVRKGKNKQGKDETDRIKQAEKKKRRLEKAIATSAAIRAELEKKKQKKKEGQQEAEVDEENSADAAKKKQEKDELDRIKQAEEQRRLDEEGAAIAEAVALHVLLDEECDDSSYRIMLNQETGFKPWDYTAKLNLFAGGRNGFFSHQRCSSPVVHRSRARDCNWSVSYEPFGKGWDDNNMRISADLIAAQAVSSLQISENACVDAVVFNGMFIR